MSCLFLGKNTDQHDVLTKRSPTSVLTKVDAVPKKMLTPTKSALNTLVKKKKPFELKINITESELVVVEDIKQADSRTVVLKTTAVFTYRPDHSSEKPISCSLESLEIFSCYLSKQDDSALSIVDPVAFLVELNHSLKNNVRSSSTGLLDAVENKPLLEVKFLLYLFY